jgi:hypothetical protein
MSRVDAGFPNAGCPTFEVVVCGNLGTVQFARGKTARTPTDTSDEPHPFRFICSCELATAKRTRHTFEWSDFRGVQRVVGGSRKRRSMH